MESDKRNKSGIKFVGLHAHSVSGSPFDALGYPQEHMDYSYQNGCDALALTDHGNMNGLPYQILHAKKMNEDGKVFKPIYGAELYFIDSIPAWKEEVERLRKEKKIIEKSESQFLGAAEDGGEIKDHFKSILKRRCHLLLLVQNQEGLYNLFKMISESHRDNNFYRYPRIDYEILKKYNKGLIASSACVGGVFGRYVWEYKEDDKEDEKIKKAIEITADKMLAIFGKERWYGELQWNRIPEQHKLNHIVIDVAAEKQFNLISTIDSHYPDPKKWKDREVYKKLGLISRSKKPEWFYEPIPENVSELNYELYPKNGDQIWQSYKRYCKELKENYDDELIKKSIERTYDIAHNEIETFYPDNTVRLPGFVISKDKNPNGELTELAIEGLKKKNLHVKKEYVERLKEELHVIQDRGFSKYFLTMKAISDKAQETQLCGAARGSAAGSLLSYVLNITQMDPIRWNLQFSRFLRSDATDYPDIDTDWENPAELKKQLIKDWGENSVVPISNWNTLQLRSLIKDISKLYDISWQEVNEVTNNMLKEATSAAKKKHGIKAGVYVPTFEELKEFSFSLQNFLEKYPHIANHIDVLYGQIRSKSKHAGGVILGEDLDKYMPLISGDGMFQTPWTEGQHVRHLEPLGFIKFDILGLSTIKMISTCIYHILKRHYNVENPQFKDIKKFYNENLHPDILDFNDVEVYEKVFCSGKKWLGVFQFTEQGAQNFCTKSVPQNITDLSAITSIFRPSCLAEGIDEKYIELKNNPQKIKYINEQYKNATQETYSLLVFQEQIASIAHELGGLTLDEGNVLRKLLIKKGIGDKRSKKNKLYDKFIKGCEKRGTEKKVAKKILKMMEYFSGYGFNKCLNENTLVQTLNGVKKIKDVKVNDKVNSKSGFTRVKNVFKQGKKRQVKIKTKSGKELICTLEHKIETKNGLKTLKEILINKEKILIKKDFSIIEDEIIDVEFLDELEETYDLEVENKSHTFFANDISVSNSHAVSYSVISYQCAWLLTHYEPEWIASFLDKEPESRKEKAINLARSLGYKIQSIDVNKSGRVWEIDENDSKSLIQPLSSIKGIGEAAIEQIIEHRPFNNLNELFFNDDMVYSKVNKKCFDALIKVQTLNKLIEQDNRINHMKHLWHVICNGTKPQTEKKFEEKAKRYMEEEDFTEQEKIEYLVSISGVFPIHLVMKDVVRNRLEELDVPSISEFNVDFPVSWFVPREVVKRKTKNNRDYYIVKVTDINSVNEVIKVWGVDVKRDNIFLNRPYMARLEYDEKWGFSTRGGVRKNFKLLG